MGEDALPFLFSFLAGIALKSDRPFAVRIALAEELLELAELAVGQCVHRIDDDCLDAAARSAAEHMIHNRDDVCEALAGTRSGRQDVGAAAAGDAHGIGLMPVEPERLPGRVLVLSDAKNPPAFLVQDCLAGEVVDPVAGFKRWIELDQRLGPEEALCEAPVDVLSNPRVADLDEAGNVGCKIMDESITKFEDVHELSECPEPACLILLRIYMATGLASG